MPETFKHKQAKELINYFKKVITNLKKKSSYKDERLNILKNQVNFFHSYGYFSKTVENGLLGKEINFEDFTTKTFISTTYNFIKASELSDICQSLYEQNHSLIEYYINALTTGKNALSWLFSSKARKSSAEDAYDKLTELKDSSFISSANLVLDEIGKLKTPSFDDIKKDYLTNLGTYEKVLKQSYGKIFTDYGLVSIVKNYDDIYQKCLKNLEEIYTSISDSIDEIKNAINKLLNEELIKTLKEIPIDELARDKSGVRIKYLKDAGFNNLAEIFLTSTNKIASIYGISEEKAIVVKDKCDIYAQKLATGLKIKLSTDDKSKAATEVVKAIYGYINKMQIQDEIDELNNDCGDNIKNSFDCLYKLENGVKWLFFSESTKEKLIESYNYIKDNLSINYKPSVDLIHKDFKKQVINYSKAWDDFSQFSINYYNVIEKIYPGVLGTDDSIYGLPEDLAKQIQNEPFYTNGLICTLRKYQEWGVKYALHQKKVLLGDEMGLGKTIQAIATMVSLKNSGATHFLVICPASVVTNWCREVSKHSELKVTKIHGNNKSIAFKTWLENGDVAITNYESTSCIKFENDYKFSLLVVDEAHYIKNTKAIRSINARNIATHADRLLFMTGTALENNVDEMISLVDALNPQIAVQVKNLAFMSSAPQFRDRIAPVYYRRKREDVLTELPNKIESKEWCSLNPEEEKVYEDAILANKYQDARRISWNIDNLNKSCKAQRLKEIVEEAEMEERKVLVFSFFLDTLAKIHKFLKEKCLTPITGSVNVNKRQEIIDEFEKAPAGTILLAQINSGGTGLNIQSASVVIICEPQFKPSIENQAISRAYRMGQSRNVLVYRLLCEETIDEKLIDVLEEKQEIFNAFADKSVIGQKSLEIDEKTFGQIIKEEVIRINQKNGVSNKIESTDDYSNKK